MEEGKKISQRKGWLAWAITGNQWTQQTQGSTGLTQQQQQLKDWTKNKLQEKWILQNPNQTTTSTPTLPWINQLQESNKISVWSNIKSNVPLPWIDNSKYPNATLSAPTKEQIEESIKTAKKNGNYKKSWWEVIEDEMYKAERIKQIKYWLKQGWWDVKKAMFWAVNNQVTQSMEQAKINYQADNELFWKDVSEEVKDYEKKIEEVKGGRDEYIAEINKKLSEWKAKNMNPILEQKYADKSILQMIKDKDWNNLEYWAVNAFSTSILPMLPSLTLWVITKNPTVATATAFSSTYVIEKEEAYEEAREAWATREEAELIGTAVWSVNWILESYGFDKMFWWFLKNLTSKTVKDFVKKGGRQILWWWAKEYIKWAWSEWLTEALQEFWKNLMIYTINPDKDIWEWVWESGFYGGVLWLWFSNLSAGSSIIKDIDTNNKIDQITDIEALNYVLESEKRKAQRDKIKQKILNRRWARSWWEVEEKDNKFQVKEWENSWFSNRNEYSEWRNIWWEKDENLSTDSMYVSDTAISENYSHGDMMTTDSFFKSDENWDYIEYDDGTRKEKIYAWSNKTTKKWSIKSQFTQQSKQTKPNSKYKEYYNNFKKLVSKLSDPKVWANDYVVIGKTWKGKDIYLSKWVLAHIFEDHGAFSLNTLIDAVNNPTWQKWESKKTKTWQGQHGTRPYMEYNIWSPDNEIMIALKPDSWEKNTDTAEYYWVVSMRESNAPTTPADNVKFQLKYEDKDYTPWVASKKEKNISGKEWLQQRNKINDETIEELARKYWVKTEVIKWMIEILRKWKLDGYAYWKYKNQLLTLSEQIKESTAPHELLHAIFDMIDPETKVYLISQVMKSEGWNAETAEEWLADSFSNFFRTGKIEWAPKSTWWRIKIFFKKVRSFINGMNKWRNELDDIFTNIITADGIEDLQGRIDENKSLEKSKEKMRKRFMEYRRNAIKMQKKTESNSNKYQEAWDINSEAFKKRFNGSKVVNEDGTPKIMYHWTEMNFSIFKRGNGEHWKWFYFTEDFDYAEEFWDVMEVYLKMENPLSENVDMNSKEMIKFINWIKERWWLSEKEIKNCFRNEDRSSELSSKIANKMWYGKKDVEKTVWWEFDDIEDIWEADYNAYLWAYAWDNWLNDLVRESWFDGIISRIYNSDAEWYEYIVFESNQIKSATDNVGTYDENNDDIRYQKMDSEQKDNDGRTLSNWQAEYFKNSKVRDKDGNLLRVYHGTKNVFTIFNGKDKNWSNQEAKVWNRFTPSKEWVKEWADENWSSNWKPRVMEWYLNITNPKIYEKWDTTEHLEKTEKYRTKLIKDINKFLDNAWYNPLKETFLKTYFEKWEDEWSEWQNRYSQRKAIEDTLRELSYIQGTYDLNYLLYMYWSERRNFVVKLREKWLSDDKIKEISKEADERLKKWKDIEIEFRKAKFTDAYELFENDLHSFAWQTVNDRVWGGWMWMNKADEAIEAYRQSLIDQGYDGIIIKDTEYDAWTFWNPNTQYASFYSNQFKNIDNLTPTEDDDIRYQRVYHWTKADFDKFDSSHMWQWEWWQAHGWWHYVAVDKKTGKRYADKQGGILFRWKKRWELPNNMKWTAMYAIMWDIMDGKDRAEAIKDESEYMLTNYLNTLDETYKNTYDYLQTVKPEDFEWNWYLYEVEIPDPVKADTPTWSNYLDEDYTLNDWEAKKMIKELKDRNYEAWKRLEKSYYEENGKSLYLKIENLLWSDKDASEFLNFIWYDGIHYDWRDDWECYVIFNDNALEIKNHEKYQKAGDINSKQFKKRFNGSKIVDNNGNPLIVYHGTHNDFTIFDRKKIWSTTNNKWIFWEWFYFTSDRKYWEYYTQPWWSKDYQALEGKSKEDIEKMRGKIMEVYLSIKNPFMWNKYKWLQEIEKIRKELKLPKSVISWNKYWDNGIHPLTKPEQSIKFREALEKAGYDWVIYKYDGLDQDEIVAFYPNQVKSATDNVGTYDADNEDIRYQKAEYEYDEDGNIKRLKFWEEKEFDPSIFWENTRQEQIEEDMEKEKSNAFYDAWVKYNNQNYEEDKLTFAEFMDAVGAWLEKQQEEYDQKMKDLAEAENDPKLLELQLRAIKLAEKEWNVGKKFWRNVSKEVRDRQQAEVVKEREDLSQEIFEWMYPWLSFEEATYEDKSSARDKEAEWEMLWREKIEEKLKLFKKDKNWEWEKRNIKIENPQEKWDKIVKSGNFEEVIDPVDRVIEWKTPEWQKGRLDKAKDPKQFKKVMEKINSWKAKTKVELKDVTNEVRALERYKENEKAEKERRKKEKQEEYAKKKQEEYKRLVRMKAFQRLVDMQRFERYPFLTEKDIKERYGFTDEEWKIITEQEEIKLPKKRGEKAISDLNKAVADQVKFIVEWLEWQNKMKRKEAEKNQWEIQQLDLDVLLWKDEEKWAKEVEEFKKIAEEEKKKSKKEKNKRLEQAREDVTNVEIDKERENNKSEKERVDKLIKSTKSDKTVWWSVKQFASNILTPVSTKIKNISPKIYREVMRYFQNKDILTNQRLKEVDPFLKTMWKIRKENPVRFMDIRVALANRNIWYANGLLKEYWVKVPTKLLDTIFDEAEDVGLNINYLGSYYPLSVKAPKSFLEELMKVGKWDIASEIEKKIQQESQKKGWPLDESEITAIINEVIAGEDKWPDVNTGNKHLKKRNTEIERTPKMLEYCDDPISTLISYIEWMTQSIERAKFLWKSRSWNVHTLADYVYNAKNNLSPEQQDELMDLLKALFNDESPNKFVQTWRDLWTLTTLWSPSSTLTQLWDLSFSVYENGRRETLKAIRDIRCKKKAFDLQEMWVLNRWEEYTNINSQKNLLQKAIHNVFKLTFFSTFDTFWKSTFIQSTRRKRQKRANVWENWDPQLIKDIMKITDDEYTTIKIINDLKNWVFSQEVALVMYMKLWNIQPLTKAQMPKAYLNNPNGRLFYQFKTFWIKQLDYVLQEAKEQTKDFKSLSTTDKFLKIAQIANMVFVMTLLWVWADELKDLTMRRRSNSLILRRLYGEDVGTEQVWEKMEDNVLKLFWLSRYTIMQMKSDPVDALTSLFTTLPATNIVNYPFKDIYKAFKGDGSINWSNPSSYQLIPVIWKYWYWIYWGGQEKQQEALDKEHKKNTTSGWSSRSTRNTRSRNTRSRNTRNSR